MQEHTHHEHHTHDTPQQKKTSHDVIEHQHDHSNHHAMMAHDFKRRFFIALAISIPVLALSPSIQQWFGFDIPSFTGDQYVLFILASVIALYTAWPFYTHAKDEITDRELGMMTLVSIAVLSGYLYSVAATFFIDAHDFYWEISTLTLVLLLGHWLEMRAVVGTAGALGELVKLIPPKAHKVMPSGSTDTVETASLVVGDTILIKPGEKVPIDGAIVEGQSSVNESLITGESKPVAKKRGDSVIGGSLNVEGALTVRVVKTGSDTALSQIVELVKHAQMSQPHSQKIADRAAHWLTIIAITVGLGTFVIWYIVLNAPFVFALTLTITVVVITCPHALGLAIPAVTTITSTLAAHNGILIKNMDGLEKAQDVDWVLFDKTGTLTQGAFGVSEVITFVEGTKDIIQLAASLEAKSEHVIAHAIVEKAEQDKQSLIPVKKFKAIPGHGVVGVIGSGTLMVGTIKLMEDNTVVIDNQYREKIASLEQEGNTVVYVSENNTLRGVIALSDTIKEESKQAIAELKTLGKQVAMITGDHDAVAQQVAQTLGIDTYFAQVLPEDKVNKVQELQKDGTRVMMVGDGINDAPALTQADVGVAIGAGTDVAVASSEIVLVKNNPLDIVKLVKLSRATMSKMKQNLVWATGYNVIAIPIAAGMLAHWNFFLRPEWGAIAMTLSSIVVVVNALLLKKISLD